MTNFCRSITLILSGGLLLAPGLHARTCSGNNELIGGYGWVGSRSISSTSTATPIVGSGTAIGALTAGSANAVAFASVGRLFLDGSGGMFASADSASPLLQVGTYTANTDCTIKTTITDVFATTAGAGLTPVQASATFEGVLVQNGNEINLVQTGTGGGALLTLRKTRQFIGCSTDGFAGTFGLAAAGVATTPPVGITEAVSTPFTLVARLVADGAGKFVQDSQSALSPLTARRMTGTYVVNSDCTGTGTLVDSDARTRKFNFVIVGAGPGPSTTSGLIVAFSDAAVVGSGEAQQQ